jgi:hypothetical protein
MGMGEKFDERATREMPAGAFATMPKQVRHYVQAKEETILDVYGAGPFDVSYVDSGDDPRKVASAKR